MVTHYPISFPFLKGKLPWGNEKKNCPTFSLKFTRLGNVTLKPTPCEWLFGQKGSDSHRLKSRLFVDTRVI